MGVLRSVARRRAESRFWGVFIIAVHRAFVLGLGAQHRGFMKSCQRVRYRRCDLYDECSPSVSLFTLEYLLGGWSAAGCSIINSVLESAHYEYQK